MTLRGGLSGVIAAAVLMFLANFVYYSYIMPMPENITAAMGTLMYNKSNMPNPVWFFVMELSTAGILAFACYQIPLTTMQVALRGALMLGAIISLLQIQWGMSLTTTMPPSFFLTEIAFKVVLGAVAAVAMTTVAKKVK